jgi:hypothetical protein
MPSSAQPAVLNPAIVGQAEKAHGAVLKRLLADTTLDEQQWITLQFAAGAGDALGRDDRHPVQSPGEGQAADRDGRQCGQHGHEAGGRTGRGGQQRGTGGEHQQAQPGGEQRSLREQDR